jgi:putative tryptophan/tyrosine transport system substrate-binding protein
LNDAPRLHYAARRRRGCLAAGGARAALGKAAADGDVPSGNPARPPDRNGWGSAWRAFFGELRRLGYVEGQNLIIDRYSAEGRHERYAEVAREIVSRNPDVIVTGTNPVVTVFLWPEGRWHLLG